MSCVMRLPNTDLVARICNVSRSGPGRQGERRAGAGWCRVVGISGVVGRRQWLGGCWVVAVGGGGAGGWVGGMIDDDDDNDDAETYVRPNK